MNLDLPEVSVIIPVYNGEKFLSEAIESVIAQTYSDWEIIAVNDGSTDKSLEILKRYEQRLPSKIMVINQKNYGISTARNRAIARAEGKYIAFLDCDDLWLPEKLEKQVEFLDSNREIGLVYSDCYIIDSNGNIIKNTYFTGKPFRGDIFKELLYVNFIPQLTVVVRREVLNKVELYDPKFKINPDYDLWLKISESYPIDFVDQPLAEYRFHREGISRNVELMINEDFQILEYWLNRKPELTRDLQSQIKQKKARLHYQLVLYYFHNHKIKKAIKECLKWFISKHSIKKLKLDIRVCI